MQLLRPMIRCCAFTAMGVVLLGLAPEEGLAQAIADINDSSKGGAVELYGSDGTTPTTPSIAVASCDDAVILDDTEQGGVCTASLRPVTTGGPLASFVITALSMIDETAPFDPNASGSTGTVVTSADGAGVKTSGCSGSKGISGGGGHRDESLIFTFDAPVPAVGITLGLNKIDFSSDDPVIFISSDGSPGFDYTILESEIVGAFTPSGADSGDVDFGALSSLPSGLLIDVFKIRETNDHIWINQVGCLADCATSGDCDDGNQCTEDMCVAGVCAYNNELLGTVCGDDGVACTDDTCDGAGNCTHTPNNGACNDNQHCNGVETCDAINDCQPGTPPDCDDAIACTSDACNEGSDTCTHTPNNGACGNGQFCDGDETCDPSLGCVDAPDPSCGDGVGCTIDACDEVNDTCTHTPDDSACNNSQFCDGNESCDLTGDCQVGTAPDCNDAVSCTLDACDEINDTCTHTPNNGACGNGQFCDGDETCDPSLGCVDAPDPSCGDGVGCTIDACDEGNDTCTHTPDDSACNNNQFCDGNEYCDLTGDCQPGTAPNCDDAVSCTLDACDEVNDVCTHIADDTACDNGLYCDGTETCDVNSDCQAGTAPDCDDGIACTVDSCDEDADTCVNSPDDSQCDDGNHCTDDACVPGTGCVFTADDSNSCSDGLFCNGLELCVAGICQTGTDPCDDGVACTVDACDEGSDSCSNSPDNTACDDLLYCTGVETCDAIDGCQPGTPVDCSNLNDQCNLGVCDDNLDTCVQQAAYENQTCNDGLFCTVDEVCIGGTCGGGTTRDCSDGIGCTVDTCDEDLDQCVQTPDDGACDNALYCDGNEFCDPNLDCQNGTEPCTGDLKCDEAGDQCVDCLTDDQCNDNLFCNGTETCVAGVCVAGTAPCGDDGISCTVDTCDDDNDVCLNTPTNGLCINGLFCDGEETCDPSDPASDPSTGCVDGANPNCDDTVSCTIDACDETNDICTHTTDDSYCDDTLYCTGVETCDLTNDCQAGTPVDCTHLNDQCNLGVCDDDLDACMQQAANENQPCDDGQFCTVQEACTAGECNGGAGRDCGDGIDCTIDTCDETGDTCLHTPQDSLCDDGNLCTDDTCDANLGCVFTADDWNTCDDGLFCTGPETCSSGTCQLGADPCDDQIDCTQDVCDEGTDSCAHSPDHGLCNNGLYCDGEEICDQQSGCIDGPDPNCDDGVDCTVDACDEANDACTHDPNDAACSNGAFCDGEEVCDAQAGCLDGPDPDCADAIDCTIDACDEAADECTHTADDSVCSNGAFCDGEEVCDVLAGCLGGPDPDCDDGIACTTDGCDEAADECTHTADDSLCNNGTFCDGEEVCDLQAGCTDGPDPDCGDGVACTIDACDPSSDSCTHTTDNALCNDGDDCTTDVCTPGGCSHSGRCGACCFADGTCTDGLDLGTCGSQGGTFKGADTVCLGDNDGDGRDDLCPGPSGGVIPTISQWGLVILTLLLLAGGKVYFGRRSLTN